MKRILISAAFVACLATAAHAMDDGERARQMALYNSQVNGGAQLTRTVTTGRVAMPTQVPTNPPVPVATPITTPPVTVPVMAPLGAPSITASKTGVSRSLPVNDAPMAMMTTTTSVTTPAATAAPTAVTTVGQMSPLNDDGSPMNVRADAGTLGQTKGMPSQVAALNGGMGGNAEQDRQLQAWRDWKAGNNGAGANTPAPYVPQQVQTMTTTSVMPMAPAYMPAPMQPPVMMAPPAAPQMAYAPQPQPVAQPAPMVEPAASGNEGPSHFAYPTRGMRERTPASLPARNGGTSSDSTSSFND